MTFAKLSANGQVTVPFEIREFLGLRSGDKLVFFKNRSGEVVCENASARALAKAQEAMNGVTERIGVKNENDVQRLVDEVRYGAARA
jgi:AbrB family looped-hinge helix DNA binding protein